MNVAFLGLGNMGSAIVPNLIKAGHKLTVYNRTRSRADALADFGARVAATPGEAVDDVQAAITMLADDRAVEDVVFSAGGLLESLPAGAIHISMGTISVKMSQRLEQSHRDKAQSYLAAPVFGRPEAAAAAKLFVVAGGSAQAVEQCQPLFQAIGQKTFRVAEAPAANLIKLAGNFLITTVIESLAEATALVRKHGVAPETFLEILTNSLFTAPVYQTYGRMVAADHFEPVGFTMPLGLKDNRLLMAAAEDAAVPMPMASLIHDRFLAAMAQGMSESDWAAIARLTFKSAGL